MSHARRSAFLLAVLSLAGCASSGAPDPGRPPVLLGLPGIVDSVRNNAPLDRTHWGVGAYDYDADRMLLRVSVDRHFVPASNMKLLVSAAALDRLGPDFRYTTTVFAENLSDGVATALVVRGSGDPTLSSRFHGSPMAAIAALADSIVAAGVHSVSGPLVIDASYFDDQHIHPSWEVGDLDEYYAAPVAAFAIEEGIVAALVLPGARVGDSARVDVISPPGVVGVFNTMTTDTAYSQTTLRLVREPESNNFHFSGRIPLNADADEFLITVRDPARYAGRVLAGLLAQRNVMFGDSVVVVNRGSTDAVSGRWDTQAASFTAVASLQSPPMADIVEAILEPSQNWIADMVLKTLGAEFGVAGSWRGGADVELDWLVSQVGVDSAAVHIVDGSGLSVQNLLTPDAIMRVLFYASEQEWGPIYRAAMPEPGEPGSTLANRLSALEGRVFAKTGSITHVNSLSGYIVAEDGRDIIFSVLSNGSGVPASFVRAGIDRIVAALGSIGAPAPPPAPRRLTP